MCGKKGNKRCVKLRHIIPCEKHEGRYYSRYYPCVSCSAAAAREEKKALALQVLAGKGSSNKTAEGDDESTLPRGGGGDAHQQQQRIGLGPGAVKICHPKPKAPKFGGGGGNKKECQRRKQKKNKTKKDEEQARIPHERCQGRAARGRKKSKGESGGARGRGACHPGQNKEEHDGLVAREKGGLLVAGGCCRSEGLQEVGKMLLA